MRWVETVRVDPKQQGNRSQELCRKLTGACPGLVKRARCKRDPCEVGSWGSRQNPRTQDQLSIWNPKTHMHACNDEFK